jgi:1-acyl-sn-glycerol-3-phosphate acyltransferase
VILHDRDIRNMVAKDRLAPMPDMATIFLRSLVFNGAFYVLTATMCIFAIWTLLLPRSYLLRVVRLWARGLAWLERHVLGLYYEIVGAEHLPEGACIVAAKHQSMWETLKLHLLFGDPAIVVKKELLNIPVVGSYLRHARTIPVDRSAPVSALFSMIQAAQDAAREGRKIVIFPQGTRIAPGVSAPYKAGVAGLYQGLGLPVVAMGLNSGLLWPKGRFLKSPGTITMTFAQAIAPGLDRPQFMEEVRRRIESPQEKLLEPRPKPRLQLSDSRQRACAGS